MCHVTLCNLERSWILLESISSSLRLSPSPRSVQRTHQRDARDDIIRREEQRRELMERRLGADPYYRDGSRQVGDEF